MIKIEKKGIILEGDKKGDYVLIQDDTKNTGGYLILTASDLDFQQGFDDWVENRVSLEKYFEEANWKIEWVE